MPSVSTGRSSHRVFCEPSQHFQFCPRKQNPLGGEIAKDVYFIIRKGVPLDRYPTDINFEIGLDRKFSGILENLNYSASC